MSGADNHCARDALALLQSCGHGRTSVAERLLAAGVSPNAVIGSDEAISVILSELSTPEAETELGRPLPWPLLIGTTPAMVAAWGGHAGVIECLALRGADLNQASPAGMTALHFAAENGRVEAALELVRKGAALDMLDERGVSPLGMAAYYGRYPSESLAIVEMLLRHGASLASVNGDSLRAATEWHREKKMGADWGWTMDPEMTALLNAAEESSEISRSIGAAPKGRRARAL